MDIMTNCIIIPVSKYEEMANKIARYNLLRSLVKAEINKGNQFPVKDDITIDLLGLSEIKRQKEKGTSDNGQ